MKKILTLVACLSLVASLAVGGSIAYLQDIDSTKNTMTMGSVYIDQLEYEREMQNGEYVSTQKEDVYGYTPDKLREFKSDESLFPAVYEGEAAPWSPRTGKDGSAHQQSWGQIDAPGSNQLFDFNNVRDKFVFVKNTGKSDAYFRTIVAVEAPTSLALPNDEINLHINDTGNSLYQKYISDGRVEIDGVNYQIFVYEYQEKLVPNEVSRPSFLQVFLDRNDGNKEVEAYGDTLDILVLSQAVQAEGFDNAATALNTAFGEVYSEATHVKLNEYKYALTNDQKKLIAGFFGEATEEEEEKAWGADGNYEIDSAEDLFAFAKMVNDGGESFSGKEVKLTKDIDLGNREWTPIGQTNGYYAKTYFQGTFNGQGHTIKNLSITSTNAGGEYAVGLFGFVDFGAATIKNVKVDTATINGHHWTAVIAGFMTGKVINCHVSNATVNCTHINNDGCGDKSGVIVGYVNDNGGTITDNSATNCTVTGSRDAGQIIGAAYVNKITMSNNEVTNVSVIAAGDCTGANIRNEIVGREL